MEKFNVCCPDKYVDKEGKEKTKFNVVGQMIRTDKGNTFIKMYNNPTIILSVFPYQERNTQPVPQSYQPNLQAQASNQPSMPSPAMQGSADFPF